jgi:hypothetical protein
MLAATSSDKCPDVHDQTLNLKSVAHLFSSKAKPLPAPSVIFTPSKQIMRIMIEANLEYAHRDSLR